MDLEAYRRKRNFRKTLEPRGKIASARKKLAYVIQKHAARRLHYDFRLEMKGVLASWAVPKGPSLNPKEHRLAVQVEDHPLEYGTFEGTIPAGQYGAGSVLLWDKGYWIPEGDPVAGWRKGKLKFHLDGKKLYGTWNLIRMTGQNAGEHQKNWLLIKERDKTAKNGDILREKPESVASGRKIEKIGRHDPQ
jgi:bifunctional non-homologous end joining protein LigD